MTEPDQQHAPIAVPTSRGAVPDLGFFAGPPAPRDAGPAAPASGFGTPAPSPFGASAPAAPVPAPAFPAPDHVGAAPAPFGLAPGGTLTYPNPYAAAPVRRGLPRWAIVLIGVGGGGLLLLVAAAVAIPVFLSQRDAAVARATTVSLADHVGELGQVSDPATRQAMTEAMTGLPACGCFQPAVAATYADRAGTHRIVVVAAKFSRPAHSQDRAAFLRGFWAGARGGEVSAGPEADQDPGALGGSLSCAPVSVAGVAGQVCVSVDAGAFVMVVDMAAGGDPAPATAVAARESVEHRS